MDGVKTRCVEERRREKNGKKKTNARGLKNVAKVGNELRDSWYWLWMLLDGGRNHTVFKS